MVCTPWRPAERLQSLPPGPCSAVTAAPAAQPSPAPQGARERASLPALAHDLNGTAARSSSCACAALWTEAFCTASSVHCRQWASLCSCMPERDQHLVAAVVAMHVTRALLPPTSVCTVRELGSHAADCLGSMHGCVEPTHGSSITPSLAHPPQQCSLVSRRHAGPPSRGRAAERASHASPPQDASGAGREVTALMQGGKTLPCMHRIICRGVTTRATHSTHARTHVVRPQSCRHALPLLGQRPMSMLMHPMQAL